MLASYKLYDQDVFTEVTVWAFVKEMGLTDKHIDYQIKVATKMMQSLMGSAFKLMKTLAPGQATEPLSNLEIVSLSDREAVIKIKNSVQLKKYRDIIKKQVLNSI